MLSEVPRPKEGRRQRDLCFVPYGPMMGLLRSSINRQSVCARAFGAQPQHSQLTVSCDDLRRLASSDATSPQSFREGWRELRSRTQLAPAHPRHSAPDRALHAPKARRRSVHVRQRKNGATRRYADLKSIHKPENTQHREGSE